MIFCERMILACTKTRNNEMKQPNWMSTVIALYEHCISTEISELVMFNGEQCGVKVSYLMLDYPTVLFKCNLTVSTRNSILDTQCFQESRIEFRGSSFKFWVLSIEFRDAWGIFWENDLYVVFVTIEINNTALPLFHISVQIVSL